MIPRHAEYNSDKNRIYFTADVSGSALRHQPHGGMHSDTHKFMRWPMPPRPHHTETIAAPSPVDPRIGRTHPADAPNTNTHDRQSTPRLYSPLDRRAEFIGSGCD